MYVISEYGEAALDVREDLDEDMSPVETGQLIREYEEQKRS